MYYVKNIQIEFKKLLKKLDLYTREGAVEAQPPWTSKISGCCAPWKEK